MLIHSPDHIRNRWIRARDIEMLIGFTDTFFVVCAAGVGAVAGAETGVDGTGTTSGTAIGAGCAAGVFISATQRKKLKARNTATIIDKRTIAPANIKVAGNIFVSVSIPNYFFSTGRNSKR